MDKVATHPPQKKECHAISTGAVVSIAFLSAIIVALMIYLIYLFVQKSAQ